MKRGLILLFLFVTAAAVTIHRVVTSKRESGWRQMRQGTAADAQNGGLQGLLRARIAGIRVALDQPTDPQVLSELAYVSASLAHHYGLTAAGNSVATFLERLQAAPSTTASAATAAASRALLALDRGERPQAEALARQAAGHDPEDVRPLLVLARIHERAGDLVAASKVAEAAAVKAPDSAAPRLEWAEARLDLGQPQAALDVLRDVLTGEPDHARAQLLAAEAQQSLGPEAAPSSHRAAGDAAPPAPGPGAAPRAATLAAVCARDSSISPVIAAGCANHAAEEARLRGNHAAALSNAEAAAATEVTDPRTLSRTALLLAQLGEVDRAEELVARAAAQADARMPALAWAQLAIALGRGNVSSKPAWLRAGNAATDLLAARAAFATGGPAALRRVLADRAKRTRAVDPDLTALASLALTGPPGAPAVALDAEAGPVHAYVTGLRARLTGDLATAARALAGALSGHGDACRAAGEYLVVMRLLRQPVADQLDPLRASNRACINLALPPPRIDPRKSAAQKAYEARRRPSSSSRDDSAE